MGDMNRRSFFRLVAGAALAPVAAQAASILPDVPILWGDGVHDDAPALNALIRGEVIEFAQPEMAHGVGWFGDYLNLPDGVFYLEDTIRFDQGAGKVVRANNWTVYSGHDGPLIDPISGHATMYTLSVWGHTGGLFPESKDPIYTTKNPAAD